MERLSSNNNSFITEEELDKLYQNRELEPKPVEFEVTGDLEYETDGIIESPLDSSYLMDTSVKQIPNSSTIEIFLSTKGRFGGFPKVEVSSYTAGDLEYLMTITKDPYRAIEVICNILNSKVVSPKGFNFYNVHIQDLLEVLAYMKFFFTSKKMVKLEEECPSCKVNLKVSLSLENMYFRSIEYNDYIFKQEFENYLRGLDEVAFKSIYSVDKNEESIMSLAKDVRIENPLKIYYGGNIYYFNIPTISDLVFSFKYVEAKYVQKERQLAKQYKNNKEELELELKNLHNAKNLDILQTLRINSLVRVNDQILPKYELRVSKFKNLPLEVYSTFLQILEKLRFGVDGIFKYTCPHCNTTVRRDLSGRLDFLNLLPLDIASSDRVSLYTGNAAILFH